MTDSEHNKEPLPGRKEADVKYRTAHREQLREASRRYYALNSEKRKASQAEYRKKHRKEAIQGVRKWRQRIKRTVMEAYGNKCACCGEDRIEFLSIDHINGGGKTHRKEIGFGQSFYSWLIKNNFPEGFRVLCFNCNLSLGFHGYCPHNNPAIGTRNNEVQNAWETPPNRTATK